MEKDTFIQYAQQGYTRVPLMRSVLADLDTPLSAYMKLADAPYSYLFESVLGGEQWGRYSIIGLPCKKIIQVYKRQIQVMNDGVLEQTLDVADPLAWVEQYQAAYKVPDVAGVPRFAGGLVGYFGFDAIRYIEPSLSDDARIDPLGTPDILLMESEEVVVFDNLAARLMVVIHADPRLDQAWEQAQQRLDEIILQLQDARIKASSQQAANIDLETSYEAEFSSAFAQPEFEAAVTKAKEYIVDGDVMQVVLSQRLSRPFDAHPLRLYRALRHLNPSPYLYYMNLNDFSVVGSSPEILTQLEDGKVTVRPIAGTRPRGVTEEEDRRLEQELLQDPKECAEHLMLIDLGRNDVGRVAQPGSVQLTEKMIIERYSHVMHIVSNVEGQLRSNLKAMDVFRATFPAGTLSGAPKIRAVEIIDELEPIKRGIYGGAIGYLAWNGNMDLAIAIRTAIIKDKQVHVQVGAGIVADSDPHLEWQETMNKGRAIFRAVAMAEAGMSAMDPSMDH